MEDKDLFGNSKIKTRNIVISGTNLWNPGDDFVRDGIIKVLKELFKGEQLNFLFYNFNQDFFPQSKFDGISNMVAAGDLDKYRDFIDAIIIPGLSAGNEIKDLYNWIIANGLQNKVYILGAGYENDYVGKHISEEPEATIFKSARIIIGRTKKRPAFIDKFRLPYHHINCPAILSVDNVKDIPQGKKIERIGFSIQLPKNLGISNQRTGNEMYKLAVQILAELSQKYTVEIVAHHKTEYFHFLNLLKDYDIPVIFSSYYHDLHNIYPRYDLVISTRLHSCLFANGFGIPAFIINETDRHTHSSAGFPHSICINNMETFQHSFNGLLMQELSSIARGAEVFKVYLMEKYVTVLADAFGASKPSKVKPLYDKLNVGCGADYREGFINIDGNPNLPRVDHVLEVKPGTLPEFFEKGSFNYIVASDFVEHYFHWEAHELLNDFYILLKDNGVLDIKLPNVENIINSTGESIDEKILWLYGGQDMQRNLQKGVLDISRQRYPQYYCHKFGWIEKTIKTELHSIGFSDVKVLENGWNMRIAARKKCNVLKQDSELRMSRCVV